MDDASFLMEIMNAKTDVDEHFPDEVVNKLLSVLFSYVS